MWRVGWKRKVLANSSVQDVPFFSSSPEETRKIGRLVRKKLIPGSIIALQGDLGAGKTTLMQGLISHSKNRVINSPTFSYLQIYPDAVSKIPIFHFDLYRLKGPQEFIQMGFTDYFGSKGICCIEWPERITSLLPPHTFFITFTSLSSTERKIFIHELE